MGAPVGVFDSGVGGLTVLRELVGLLPSSQFLYYADSAHCPYGAKPPEAIVDRARRITQWLLGQGCQLVVVACNTATAAAIDWLRGHFPIPFVGMEPAIKPAALATQTKAIGVLATAGTFNGRLYQSTVRQYAQGIEVIYQVGDGLVELVEQGLAHSDRAEQLLRRYTAPMLDANVDHIVLGCTHFPLLTAALRRVIPAGITIVNPAPAVARQALRVLQADGGELTPAAPPSNTLCTSGDARALRDMVRRIEGMEGMEFPAKAFYRQPL